MHTVPSAQTVNEDTALAISGLSINDVDVGSGNLTTQLSVANGTLNLSLAGGASISAGANDSGTLTLSGTQAQINAALATVIYQGNLNFNGADNLQIVTNDLGNSGAGGALTDADTVAITVNAVNDAAIIGGAKSGSVVEAGGVANAQVNIPTAAGTVTATDVDNPNTFIAQPTTASVSGFGSYQIIANGDWLYTLNNNNPAVEALGEGDTLTDSFTVQSADGTNQVITITINGRNDSALTSGVTSGTVIEAGGIANGTVGTPTATGALAAKDNDGPASFQVVPTAVSAYGNYQVSANGVWTYTLNNTNSAVQALNVSDTLTDTFTVRTVDNTQQVVTILIKGSTDLVIGDTNTTGGGLIGGNVNDDAVRTFTTAAEPSNGGKSSSFKQSAILFDPLANSADLFGAVNADVDAVRRDGVRNLNTAIALQGSLGFISTLSLAVRQANASTDLTGYDFGEYTFQLSRFAMQQQVSGRISDTGDVNVVLQDSGSEEARGSAVTTSTIVRTAGISLTLGVAAWALRSGGLVAAMLSSLPAWRQVDLLPILGDPGKRKAGWDEDRDVEAAREERAVDRMLGTRPRSDEA